MVITEQPLPQVLFKGKQLDNPFIVKLLTGTSNYLEQVK